jgi:diphosphoinositol-polyphosphate diphosphatase
LFKPGAENVENFGTLQDFLGNYEFKSKSHQDEFSPEGLCKAAMYALYVKEELATWPEHETRTRKWLTIEEAVESCRHPWMKDALVEGFCKWHKEKMVKGEEITGEH